MELFLIFLIVSCLALTLVHGGNYCKKNQNINIIGDIIQKLSGELLCVISQFLSVSEFEIFYQNFNMPLSKQNQCRVEFQTRFYGKPGFVEEYFGFKKITGNVLTPFWPSTLQQMAYFPIFIENQPFLIKIILYQSGIFEIKSNFIEETDAFKLNDIKSFFIDQIKNWHYNYSLCYSQLYD